MDLGDVILIAIKTLIAVVILRWIYDEIVEELSLKALWAKLKPRRAPRLRLKAEKVFHVSASDGRTEIVIAKDERASKDIGAASLGVPLNDVVSAEVYNKAVRK